MIPTRIGRSQRRILEHLKRSGPATIPEVAATMELSVETIRTHMRYLEARDLVVRGGRRTSGPGRPEIVYELGDSSEVLFPNREGALLGELAEYIRSSGQAELINRFFDARLERRRDLVRRRLEGLEGEARLLELARALSDDGYMAEVQRTPDGRPLLRLCNCPLRNLVDATAAPCRAELAFVQELLGRSLERVSYIPDGDGSCCYAVVEEAVGA
ncbi:helix-turn-helix domain-containing protein [Gaopeijia maritima]|uniref:helix-turn-helix transcriptional regulator n=1 Tax=Gaopeijia maritima TaxID=3119007 RepID=UPI00324FB927